MTDTDITQKESLMRVFITGASGWIGSHVTAELLAHGHEVLGLARTDASATRVESLGAAVHRGDLDDLDSLRAGAEATDAVIHLGFKHDFSNFAASGATERAVIEMFGDVLEGSGKPFAFASGVAGLTAGRPATENDPSPYDGPDAPRGGVENLALGFADRGIRSMALRFSPTVHGMGDHGFTATLARIAREKGAAAYVGDGSHRWPAVHVDDAARMVRLGVEKAPAGSRLHGVAEEGVAGVQFAQAFARRFDVPVISIAPEQVTEHFGWIGMFFGRDMPASSTITRDLLGWAPAGSTLVEDIDAGAYPGQDAHN